MSDTNTDTSSRELAARVARRVDGILTPSEVRRRCQALAEHPHIRSEVIGHGIDGTPIEAYGYGPADGGVLCYGCPDPGEVVGATGIIALIEALLSGEIPVNRWNVGWCFVPVLNPDDQPASGERLETVMKAQLDRREVDWCLDHPRPETRALLDLAESMCPQVTFAMHDEYHCGEPIPVYLPVSHTLDASICHSIRDTIESFGLVVSDDQHPEMGRGFLAMQSAPDYSNSTFSRFAEHGTVLICEVSQQPGVEARALVAAQLGALFALLG